jgi:hypothetical protein
MTSIDARALYLDLIEKCLLNTIYEDPPQDPWSGGKFSAEARERGQDWPSKAHTMIGHRRLSNLRRLCEDVLQNRVPGDFIETGIWRGGACILMRAVLKAFGATDRVVWCADSFEGLPPPDPQRYPQDAGDTHHRQTPLKISLEEVQENFRKYGLLDSQVRFLKGWFKDTLPNAPIEKLAMLRLDGDMYQSTMEAISALYDKVSPGGFIVVDDFGAVPACRQAILDFARARSLDLALQKIDWTGVYWRKAP